MGQKSSRVPASAVCLKPEREQATWKGRSRWMQRGYLEVIEGGFCSPMDPPAKMMIDIFSRHLGCRTCHPTTVYNVAQM